MSVAAVNIHRREPNVVELNRIGMSPSSPTVAVSTVAPLCLNNLILCVVAATMFLLVVANLSLPTSRPPSLPLEPSFAPSRVFLARPFIFMLRFHGRLGRCACDVLAAGGRWTLDWKGMEAAMKEHPETALLMLCNPFNPVGEKRERMNIKLLLRL